MLLLKLKIDESELEVHLGKGNIEDSGVDGILHIVNSNIVEFRVPYRILTGLYINTDGLFVEQLVNEKTNEIFYEKYNRPYQKRVLERVITNKHLSVDEFSDIVNSKLVAKYEDIGVKILLDETPYPPETLECGSITCYNYNRQDANQEMCTEFNVSTDGEIVKHIYYDNEMECNHRFYYNGNHKDILMKAIKERELPKEDYLVLIGSKEI